jgi:asparagine synthase (glutamine-hydrolysing)
LTALAGFVGTRFASHFQKICVDALQAQSLYSRGEPRLAQCDQAAFGSAVFPTLSDFESADTTIETERWLFVADARIDNRHELLGKLGLRPHSDALSDSAILFKLWNDAEIKSLDDVVGDFAFAAFDKLSRALWLARDPTGQRPLFYSALGEGAAFASMPSGLFEVAGGDPDIRRLTLSLEHRSYHDEDSYFIGIKRVLPGCAVKIDASGSRSNHEYWRPCLEPLRSIPEESIEECRDLLNRSVAAQLRQYDSTRPISTHLSSGLDSSTVTATAARLLGPERRLIAFTSAPIDHGRNIGPHNRPTDESSPAAETAAELVIDHEVVRDSRDMFSTLENYSRHFQEPPRNLLNLGWWDAINGRIEALGGQVLLTAEFGNATINAGGIEFLADYIDRLELRRWFAEARSLIQKKGVRWRGVALNSFEHLFPRRTIDNLIARRAGGGPRAGFLQPRPSDPVEANERGRFPHRSAGRLWALTACDFGAVRKGTLGRHGVDERDPMSNRRLIEFGLRLPTAAFLAGGEYSPFARQVIADRVPAHVLKFSSRGFQGGDWPLRLKRQSAAEAIESIANSPGAQELLDFGNLRNVVDHWPQFATGSMADLVFARDFTAAIAAGRFIADIEQDRRSFGRRL